MSDERDVYVIPQNFVDTGTIMGGSIRLRNAIEAGVLVLGSAIPVFYLPLAFNYRIMLAIAICIPLGVLGVVGIGGDSLTQFIHHWFRFKQAGLSVHDLQSVFGFNSPQAIYKWQNGVALPTLDNLIVLAAVLGVRLDDIVITHT